MFLCVENLNGIILGYNMVGCFEIESVEVNCCKSIICTFIFNVDIVCINNKIYLLMYLKIRVCQQDLFQCAKVLL